MRPQFNKNLNLRDDGTVEATGPIDLNHADIEAVMWARLVQYQRKSNGQVVDGRVFEEEQDDVIVVSGWNTGGMTSEQIIAELEKAGADSKPEAVRRGIAGARGGHPPEVLEFAVRTDLGPKWPVVVVTATDGEFRKGEAYAWGWTYVEREDDKGHRFQFSNYWNDESELVPESESSA